METLRNNDVPMVSSLLTLKRFTPFLSISLLHLEKFASCVYQQRSKYRQVKITKLASTGTNYAILTKQVKLQHEKKPASNLKSMQIVGFEQASLKYIEIFVP